MKFSHLVSNLRNSTKATVIACSVFLAATALILFFLILFPIPVKDRSAALSAPIVEATSETTTATRRAKTPVSNETEPPHTLSTWAVSIETLEGTTDPDEIPWYDKLFTTTESSTNISETSSETETQTETEPIMTEIIQPEPVTELITEPPVQTVTETVTILTDPPATTPIQSEEAELASAAPIAPDF